MDVSKIHHIGIAVKNLEEALHFYNEALGLKTICKETIPQRNLQLAFLACGDVKLELLQGSAPDNHIVRFVEEKGEGLHHLALKVENIDEALVELKAKGVPLKDEKARTALRGMRVAYLDGSPAGGVSIELVEVEEK